MSLEMGALSITYILSFWHFFLGFFCKEMMEDSNSLSPSPGRQELKKKMWTRLHEAEG